MIVVHRASCQYGEFKKEELRIGYAQQSFLYIKKQLEDFEHIVLDAQKELVEKDARIKELEEELASLKTSKTFKHNGNDEVYQIIGEVPVKMSGMKEWKKCVIYKNKEQMTFVTDRERLVEKFTTVKDKE